ncbi:hypothetical protein LCGC14_1748360 [marine sediment metagenome]|uniref:Uncharacterized protein n=1 Tax=marine sediment metagenome TaxID=412755 RepID=A0A0F9HS06_9ZZZZ
MSDLTARVRLPGGKIVIADLGSLTGTGHRIASARITNTKGRQVRIAGRVTTRHGYDQTLAFEVNMGGINARSAFVPSDELFVRAA